MLPAEGSVGLDAAAKHLNCYCSTEQHYQKYIIFETMSLIVSFLFVSLLSYLLPPPQTLFVYVQSTGVNSLYTKHNFKDSPSSMHSINILLNFSSHILVERCKARGPYGLETEMCF